MYVYSFQLKSYQLPVPLGPLHLQPRAGAAPDRLRVAAGAPPDRPDQERPRRDPVDRPDRPGVELGTVHRPRRPLPSR